MSIHTTNVCPKCEADLQGAPIPEEALHYYYPPGTPKEEMKPKYYSKVIGLEYNLGHPEHYDGISEWLCPLCGYREGRWSGKELKEGEDELRFGGER